MNEEAHIICETSAYKGIFSTFCMQELPIETHNHHLTYERIQKKAKLLESKICHPCVQGALKTNKLTIVDIGRKKDFLSLKEREIEDVCQLLRKLNIT